MKNLFNSKSAKLACLTDSEKKIRYFWLIYMVIQQLLNFKQLLNFIYMGCTVKLQLVSSAMMLTIVVSVIMTLILDYVLFRCIFQKHGTKLLTALIVMGVIGIPFSLWMPLKAEVVNFVMLGFSALGWIGLFLHWKLRRINKKIQAQG